MKKALALVLCALMALAAAGAETGVYATSLAQLILRYNDIVHGSLPIVPDIPKIDVSGSSFDSTTFMLNENCALSVRTESGTGEIQHLMLFASGSGTAMSGLTILQTAASIVAAYGFADTLAGGFNLMKKAGFVEDDAFDGSLHEYPLDGHNLSYAYIQGVGLMVTISKEE